MLVQLDAVLVELVQFHLGQIKFSGDTTCMRLSILTEYSCSLYHTINNNKHPRWRYNHYENALSGNHQFVTKVL